MNPKSCLGLSRAFLFLFNLLFFALGCLLLATSLWVLLDRQSFAALLGSPLSGLRVWAWVCAGAGALALLLGGLGGLGALRASRALLGLYFGVLLLLLVAQVTLAALGYTQRDSVAAALAASAQELIRGYPTLGAPGDPHESWDALQQQLGCCGWTGPQDWEPPGIVACSCLRAPNGTHGRPTALPHGRCPTAGPREMFHTGCAESVWGWLDENLLAVVGGSVGFGLLELCLLMLSMFLVRNLDPHCELR
ncbi:leukocyte antigen CD37-like [Phaenicophaeus curvirostris]|uniref:leukocyte antigen CD37-like n=1 Tax=Phaenicophaeus curvirostris TaxID=33595 RepID=UPI0037F0E905